MEGGLTAGVAIATIEEVLKEVKAEDKDKVVQRLLKMLQNHKPEEKEEDEEDEEDEDDEEETKNTKKEDKLMDSIVETLRKEFPLSNECSVDAKGEHSASDVDAHGESEMFRGCTDKDTVAVDAFLYDDDAIDEACDAGTFSRHYCAACGSRDVRPLNFISHSLSRDQLAFVLSDAVLGQRALRRWVGKKGLTVVDVGSRLGAVLYGFALHLPRAEVHGVEQSAFFCDVQRRVLRDPRFARALAHVHVVQDDVRHQGALLQRADIVVLNNVFEFFAADAAEERRLWAFVMANVTKPGCLLVTVPSLEEVAERLNKRPALGAERAPAAKRANCGDEQDTLDFFTTWVEPVQINYPLDDDIPESVCEMQALINLYRVK